MKKEPNIKKNYAFYIFCVKDLLLNYFPLKSYLLRTNLFQTAPGIKVYRTKLQFKRDAEVCLETKLTSQAANPEARGVQQGIQI